MRDEFELSRRKMLAGLGTVGVASAGAGMGTSAFFSDTEEFEGNSLVAGELDLKVDWEEHYSDWSIDENDDRVVGGFLDGDLDESDADSDGDGVDDFDVVMTNGDQTQVPTDYVGLPTPVEPLIAVPDEFRDDFMANTAIDSLPDSDDDGIQDTIYTRDQLSNAGYEGEELEEKFRSQFADMPRGLDSDMRTESERGEPLIELEDVKPGDFGEVTFSFHLFNNPGYIWIDGELVEAAENGHTEPEAEDGDETGPADERSVDADTAQVELLDEIEVLVWHDEGDNVPDDTEEVYLRHDDGKENIELTRSEAEIWRGTLRGFFQELSGNGIALDGDPRTEMSGRDCYPNSTTRYVGFGWWLPVDHANELQGDSVRFDLGFYTEQCRHNDGSRTAPEQGDSTEGDLRLSATSAPDASGGTFTHTYSFGYDTDIDTDEISRIRIHHLTNPADVSNVDQADVTVENTTTGVIGNVGSASGSNNGETLTVDLSSDLAGTVGDTVEVSFSDVQNPSASFSEVRLTVNPQSTNVSDETILTY